MKKLIIYLHLILPLLTSAQNNDSLKTRKFSFGLSFSPDLSFRSLISNERYKPLKEERNGSEIPKIGLTTGIVLNFKITSRFSLSSGAFYADKGYRTKTEKLIWVINETSLPSKTYTKYHFHYISVPIKIDYYFKTKKSKFYISSGLSADIFIRSTSQVYIKTQSNWSNTKNIENIEYLRFNYMLLVGVGADFQINKSLSLKLEPTFRHSIRALNPNLKIKEYQYSLGLNVGLLFKLKKR